MSNTTLTQRDELLEAVRAPQRKKKPNNFALYAAIVFANIVFVVLDLISGLTVYSLTKNVLYGILTFLAGALPLILHESLYVRAYASPDQKRIAISGAVIALISIVLIGVLAGIVNVQGITADTVTIETALIWTLIVIASIHALGAAAYFYIDDGIRMNQQTAQAVARAINQGKMIQAGDMILSLTEKSVASRKNISNKFGSPAALQEILRQMGQDDDGDGIPNIIDPDWQPQHRSMPQYAAETRVPPGRNGQRPQPETDFTEPSR